MIQPIVIQRNTRVYISPNVYARKFGTELILLDFSRGEYFGLDDVGAEIWRHFERGDSLGTTADALAETFDVTREQAFCDVRALATSMQANSLVNLVRDDDGNDGEGRPEES